MKSKILIGLTAGLLCQYVYGTVLGGAQDLPEAVTEKLPMTATDHEIPLMIHRMVPIPASGASRNQRFIFAEKTLMKLDGMVYAGIPVQAFRERITQRASFGATFPGSHMKPAGRGFTGLMRDMKLIVQADRISAPKNGASLD